MIHLNEQSQLADLFPLQELRQMSNAYDQKILETRRRLSLKNPQDVGAAALVVSPKHQVSPEMARDSGTLYQRMAHQITPERQELSPTPVSPPQAIQKIVVSSPPRVMLGYGSAGPKQYKIGQDVDFERAGSGDPIAAPKNPIAYVQRKPLQKPKLLPKDVFIRQHQGAGKPTQDKNPTPSPSKPAAKMKQPFI